MAFIPDYVLDLALAEYTANADRLDICSQEPATLTEATSTYTLGNKTSITVGSPTDASPNGRKVTISAITDGAVTGSGTASHYGVSDAGVRLLAAESLSASQVVTSGNTFSLGAIDIRFPDAA